MACVRQQPLLCTYILSFSFHMATLVCQIDRLAIDRMFDKFQFPLLRLRPGGHGQLMSGPGKPQRRLCGRPCSSGSTSGCGPHSAPGPQRSPAGEPSAPPCNERSAAGRKYCNGRLLVPGLITPPNASAAARPWSGLCRGGQQHRRLLRLPPGKSTENCSR